MADGSTDIQAGAGYSQMFALGLSGECGTITVDALSAFVYVDTV